MDCAVQGQVELDVPLEPVDDGPLATDAELEARRVRDLVGDDVPVPGWRLRLRPVGPVLGQDPVEIGAADDVRGIWLARGRVDVVPVAVVGAEGIVPRAPGPMSMVVGSVESSSALNRMTSTAWSLNAWSVAASWSRGGRPGSMGVPVSDGGSAKEVTCPSAAR